MIFKKNILTSITVGSLLISSFGMAQTSDKKDKAPFDLTHWKVTIPEGNPTSLGYPEILGYNTNESINKYMYNDPDGAVVFYAYPSGVTTTNTHYSRSELREQLVPGKNDPNWTFSQGGRMKGTLAMGEVSKSKEGKFHKVIIMQIHGRLSNAQKDLIGEDDNNAPPILKIYWDNGKIRVKTKILKDKKVSDTDMLSTKAWKDDKGYNFKEKVNFDKFTLEVIVSKGRLEVVLNNNESVVYRSSDLKKWGVFENYFKAGNYLQTNDEGAFAKVKYYSLDVSH
ncbi:MAG: polysaccharide lyase family 7 protein [Flavobacterium sp.]|uniref:polysaccharide lyase family 7 protein n=1 Tax=Flavobacterium frigidarium TaxID=99286 RepID=UPI0030DCDE25|nr:polysaccharide lyase family 7 protein [Flavobacterium sp.]